MAAPITADALAIEARRLSDRLDRAVGESFAQARNYADAEDAYRMAYAKAYLRADGPAHERKYWADLETSDERRAAHYAEGVKQSALEAVRSIRGQLSALQTIANAYRAEAEFARTGPRGET